MPIHFKTRLEFCAPGHIAWTSPSCEAFDYERREWRGDEEEPIYLFRTGRDFYHLISSTQHHEVGCILKIWKVRYRKEK